MANSEVQGSKGIDIPALRKQGNAIYNLMAGGPGTPWEDRDSLGFIPAFFKTCMRSMLEPTTLFNLIRRLQYRTDARLFVIGIAFFWFLSGMMHGGLYYRSLIHSPLALAPATAKHIEIDPQMFFIGWTIFSLVLASLLVGMMELVTKFYYSMVSGGDMKGRGSPELVYNVFAYCLGPGVLVLIPYAGPVIALAWALVLAIRAGITRLHINTKGSVISALLCCGACLVMSLVIFYVGYRLVNGFAITEIAARRR